MNTNDVLHDLVPLWLPVTPSDDDPSRHGTRDPIPDPKNPPPSHRGSIYTLVYASICYNTVYFLSCVIYRSVLVWLPVAPQFGPHDSPVDSFPDPKHPPHQPLGN